MASVRADDLPNGAVMRAGGEDASEYGEIILLDPEWSDFPIIADFVHDSIVWKFDPDYNP